MRRVLAALAPVLVAVLVGCPSSRTEGLDPSRVPDNLRADYEVFAHRCSKCHSLARPLNAGITDDEQWVLYVNRMRRQPGSGISQDDQQVILRFLKWYAAETRKAKGDKSGPPPPPPPSAGAPPGPAPHGGAP